MTIDTDFEHEAKMRAIEAEVRAANTAESIELERSRPFMLLRPRMSLDGNQWCALYGDNLQDGVAGFGDTPAKAAVDFDIQWLNAKARPKLVQVDELATLVRRLAHALRKAAPDNEMAPAAMDYLQRNGLSGNAMRDLGPNG